MDFKDPIENSIKTIQKILEFTKGTKLIIAMDSNARSTTWYDVSGHVQVPKFYRASKGKSVMGLRSILEGGHVEATWRLDRKILKLCTYHVQDRRK